MRKPKAALTIIGLVVAGSVVSSPRAGAQTECRCPDPAEAAETGRAPLDHTGSEDPALDAEQREGNEPDDFEFEAAPSDRFDQEQTGGDEPDDFEFEGE